MSITYFYFQVGYTCQRFNSKKNLPLNFFFDYRLLQEMYHNMYILLCYYSIYKLETMLKRKKTFK